MTVRKNKKSHPTYILITIDDQLSLSHALFNISLTSLVRSLLSSTRNASDKPAWRRPRGAADPALLHIGLLLPMADCVQRVDRAVERLDREIDSFQRAFEMMQKQFERIDVMMDNIMNVMTLLSQRASRREGDGAQRVCECGRPIPAKADDEDKGDGDGDGDDSDAETGD
ncbi:hypothetical protein APHAL10511_007987 [Amanita phalloides]|nr:hypothetical protein APHAL10511_007987 [Amanita phalloides]